MDFFLLVSIIVGIVVALGGLFFIIDEGEPIGLVGILAGLILSVGALTTNDTVNALEAQAKRVPVLEQTVKEQKSALEEAAVLNGVLQKRAAKTASLQGQLSGLESVVARYKGDNASLKETNAVLEGKLSAATNNLQTCEIEQGSILLEKDIVEAKLEKVTKLVGGVL